jgi:hypothetical protein
MEDAELPPSTDVEGLTLSPPPVVPFPTASEDGDSSPMSGVQRIPCPLGNYLQEQRLLCAVARKGRHNACQ